MRVVKKDARFSPIELNEGMIAMVIVPHHFSTIIKRIIAEYQASV